MSETIAQALSRMGTPFPFEKKQRARKPRPPYQAHSVTSREAADLIADHRMTLCDKVYALLQRGPLTDEQIAVTLKLNPSTARPRRIELVDDGLVVQVGTAKNLSGRKAALWGMAPSIGDA